MATTIRITLNDDIEALLSELKQAYPALDYPEILKLALSDYYRRHKQALVDEERSRIIVWEQRLPHLELSDEAKEAVATARESGFVEASIDELTNLDV